MKQQGAFLLRKNIIQRYLATQVIILDHYLPRLIDFQVYAAVVPTL